jgi:hypothetical protein
MVHHKSSSRWGLDAGLLSSSVAEVVAGSCGLRKDTAVNKTLGIILIVLGLFGLAWGGFTYTTTEKIVDIGPIHATRDKTHDVPLPPIAGAVALIGGVVLLVAGRKG